MLLAIWTPFMITMLLTSIILAISSASWIAVWVGFELNMLTFILFTTLKNTPKKSTAAISYFTGQAIGSFFILAAAALLFSPAPHPPFLFFTFMLTGILIKAAAAPVHQWFISAMAHLDWMTTWILLTLQKISPLALILTIIDAPTSLELTTTFIILSLIIGAQGAMNHPQLQMILAFSAINHTGWLLLGAYTAAFDFTVKYFIIYICTLGVLLSYLQITDTSTPWTARNLLANHPTLSTWILAALIISQGGVPPLLGFLFKLQLTGAITVENLPLALLMLVTSAWLLKTYLSFAISFLSNPPKSHAFMKRSNPFHWSLAHSSLLLMILILTIFALVSNI